MKLIPTMDVLQSIKSSASASSLGPGHKILEAARKKTVIELRWPLVILCAYLLLYAPSSWLTPPQTNAVLIFYLIINATFYFIADDFFDSAYFYGPLLLFDTVFLAVALVISGGATTDFFIACLFTFVLSYVSKSSRGLLLLTLLAPLLYAYVVLTSTAAPDASLHLRLLVPLAVAVFSGYFAQIERIKHHAKKNKDQERKEITGAEESELRRGRLRVLQDVSVTVTSSVDLDKTLDLLLEKALVCLPYAAAMLRLNDRETGILLTVRNEAGAGELATPARLLLSADEIPEAPSIFLSRNVFTDPRMKNLEWFRQQGLVSLIGLPIVADGESLGSVVFLRREEYDFCQEEVEFLSTFTGQLAIAIYHSQLCDRIRQQRDELRQANKVKEEFLGVIYHQLKTPLNAISGYTSMLSDGMLGEITPIQEKALQTLSRQSKELHNLIDSVLQVHSLDAEMIQTELQPVNLWDFLCELRALYDCQREKDVKTIWAFRADLPILYSDRRKLKHILENLINNAIKCTDQGSVTISSRYLPNKKVMEFKVTDTGTGIPRDLLPTIFERFQQLDNPASRTQGGVGLGLYIVKQYTDLLGGAIHVESKLGQGSTFTLRFPSQPTSVFSEHEQLSFPMARQSSGSNAA